MLLSQPYSKPSFVQALIHSNSFNKRRLYFLQTPLLIPCYLCIWTFGPVKRGGGEGAIMVGLWPTHRRVPRPPRHQPGVDLPRRGPHLPLRPPGHAAGRRHSLGFPPPPAVRPRLLKGPVCIAGGLALDALVWASQSQRNRRRQDAGPLPRLPPPDPPADKPLQQMPPVRPAPHSTTVRQILH
jgi:hypothetical protein